MFAHRHDIAPAKRTVAVTLPVVGNRLFHHDRVGWPGCTNDGQRTAL